MVAVAEPGPRGLMPPSRGGTAVRLPRPTDVSAIDNVLRSRARSPRTPGVHVARNLIQESDL